jgi:hypothetical protein
MPDDNAKATLAQIVALVSTQQSAETAALVRAARAVVFARYDSGPRSWEMLKRAISALEDCVGCPITEGEI